MFWLWLVVKIVVVLATLFAMLGIQNVPGKNVRWFVGGYFLIVAVSALVSCFTDVLDTLVGGVAVVVVHTVWALKFGKVEKNPPHEAILTFMGKRLANEPALKEGLNPLPFWPLFNMVVVKVEKVNDDLDEQLVRTPDNAQIKLSPSVSYVPGIKDADGNTTGESLIAFLNSKGEGGVKAIIDDIIDDRAKRWARSNKEGPATWTEAEGMKDDAHAVLSLSLLGDMVGTVPWPDVPVSTLMRYFDTPQSMPTDYDASPRNGWASKTSKDVWNWDDLDRKFLALPAAQQTMVKDAVNTIKKNVADLREGSAKFSYASLGITIVRFSISDIQAQGEVAEAAGKEEKERLEQQAEQLEADNVAKLIAKYIAIGLSPEKALEAAQTERGKVKKTIVETTGSGTGIVIAGDVLDKLLGGRGGPSGNP